MEQFQHQTAEDQRPAVNSYRRLSQEWFLFLNGSERAPEESASADAKKKFKTRSNKALSIIVLSMKPELHYPIGREPEDPVAVWKLLSDHFERKTWGNCYELWKRLISKPRMKEIRDGGSVDEHLKSLQEIFDSLAALEDPRKSK